MTNLNVVVLEGRLVRDAQDGYRMSNDGQTPYGEFTIAVNESRKTGDQWEDKASFIDCKGFGRRYDSAVRNMTKGAMVRVVGRLKQDSWTNSKGEKRSKLYVSVDEYHFDMYGGQKFERPGDRIPADFNKNSGVFGDARDNPPIPPEALLGAPSNEEIPF